MRFVFGVHLFTMRLACYAHAQAPTVAACSDCNRGLCRRCDELVRPPLCSECIERRAHELRSHIVQQALYAVLLGTIIACVLNRLLHVPLWADIVAGYFAGSALYGAEVVRQHLSARVLVEPFLGRLLRGLLLCASSIVVGALTLPFLLTKSLLDAHRLGRIFTIVQRTLHPPVQSRILSVRVEHPGEPQA